MTKINDAVLCGGMIHGETSMSVKDLVKAFPIPLTKKFNYEVKDMSNVRVLKGWTKIEREELEDATSDHDLFHIFGDIFESNSGFTALNNKLNGIGIYEEADFSKDIADFYTGKAKFPDKKYYVHFIEEDEDSYLTINNCDENKVISSKDQNEDYQTQFTKEEVLDINPKYEPFMEVVPENELVEE